MYHWYLHHCSSKSEDYSKIGFAAGKRDAAVEDISCRIFLDNFKKKGAILSLILFRCAKRFILPDRTTLLENELARLQSEFHSAKSQNSSLVVCIPSSRQLKKYKIFVLPGVYRATFLCRQSLLFMKFHWC